QHPRVRYKCAHALKIIATTEYGRLTATSLNLVFVSLSRLLSDPIPRVAARAAYKIRETLCHFYMNRKWRHSCFESGR
ncbi:hypothetical protein PMAYCL1PPCAC_06178, partial [Pristionchus mayeri]